MISTISRGMKERIISKGIEPGRLILFPNWVDTDWIRPINGKNDFREKYDLGGMFIVLYSGNIGEKQGVEIILDVARSTSKIKDIIYVIVGDGARRKELAEKHRQMALKNVRFIPIQPEDRVPHMLSAANVCLVPQKAGVMDLVMPSKLTTILSSGKPVIVSAKAGSEIHKLVEKNQCGIVVEPGNSHQMYDAIMLLYKDKQRAEAFGSNGREYAVKRLAKESILSEFERKVIAISKGSIK